VWSHCKRSPCNQRKWMACNIRRSHHVKDGALRTDCGGLAGTPFSRCTGGRKETLSIDMSINSQHRTVATVTTHSAQEGSAIPSCRSLHERAGGWRQLRNACLAQGTVLGQSSFWWCSIIICVTSGALAYLTSQKPVIYLAG
jgi:hypothetical protein